LLELAATDSALGCAQREGLTRHQLQLLSQLRDRHQPRVLRQPRIRRPDPPSAPYPLHLV